MAQGRHRGGARATAVTVAALIAVAAGGCGTRVRSQLSALSPTTTAPPATTSTTARPATTTSTTVPPQIKANWETFFNAQTPLAEREAVLEDGKEHEQAILTASKNPLQAQASARVTKVELTSSTRATVTYDVLINGQTALGSSTGTAVLQDGVWKVSVQSFCALLGLMQVPIPGC